MAQQSFIWTALPNGYTSDHSALRLSIMLSPRLDPEDPLGAWKSLDEFFPDWEDWPSTLAKARFDVSFGADTVSVAATATSGAHRVDDRHGLADSAAWKALFTSRLFVRSFEFTDLSNRQIVSYDTGTMTDLIEGLYGELARNAGDDLPVVSELLGTHGVRSLAALVAELDAGTWNPHTGLRDPDLLFRQLDAPKPGTVPGLADTLARFLAFHTPPAKPKPRTETRTQDDRIKARWLEYERAELPQRDKIAETLDFHAIVAALGSYPVLLRRLGLVVDLQLDASAFTPAAAADLSVEVEFPAGTLTVARADANPVTRTRLTAAHFDAVPSAGAPMPIKDRLLDVGSGNFRLLQVDLDGSGLKLLNLLRSLRRRYGGDAHVDAVSRHESAMGVPALRTGGLTLVQRFREQTLHSRFLASKSKNAGVEDQFGGSANPVALHAEDLVRGYRIDIWDSVTAQWRSLCRRTATYELGGGAVVVSPDPEEESTVRLAATQSSDGHNAHLLYLHEALVAWTGWSLAAPPPGRAIGTGDSVDKSSMQSEAELPPGLEFKSTFRAIKGSLPRLRFGRSYRIRARAVDLAGNSLEAQSADFGPEQPVASAQTYRRFEPLAAPVIALLSAAGTIRKPAEGESMLRVAIRSFNDAPADNLVPTAQVAVRIAAPPQVGVRDAEQHGMLDADGKLDSSLFGLLAHQKDVDPRDPSAAIREVVLPMQGPLDATPVPTTYAVYEAGRAMTYLPDPLAMEVVARFFDHPNVPDSEYFRIPLYPSGGWPEAQPFAIELYDDPLAAPHFETGARKLRVPLPKGVHARLRLSMALPPVSLPQMGIYALLDAAARAAQYDRATNGQHWMLTPWTTLDVVHAVQRPLIEPDVTTLTVLRELNATSARPLLHARCSIDSTARLELFGEWHEPLDDPAAPDAEAGPVDRQRRDCAFQVKITGPKHYADATAGAPGGGSPEHTVSGQDLVGVNLSSDARLPVKAHEFHDTRYRRIEYWFEATTRFREYLPGALLTTFVDGANVATDERIKVTGARSVTWVPSSAPPPAPKVLYVVPTFGWERTVDEGGTLESRRRGGGLRVYLDRDWNASGYGEMLGVLLPPARFAGDPGSEPAGTPYKNYVTLWGNDPIWDSGFVPGIAPTPERFPRARSAPDPAGGWLPPNAPDSEKDQRPGAFAVRDLPLPGDKRPRAGSFEAKAWSLLTANRARAATVDVAPHDVYFDSDRRLWYCDIEIATGNAYFPFVRLALSRYQPTSVAGAHLSNVVLADIIALTADRWLNVTPEPDSRTLRVAVFGVSYYESSAHHEAERSLGVSLFEPLTGTAKTLRPAKVAERAVVELWVERLTPEWGEDFGWRRVGDVIVTQEGSAGRQGILSALEPHSTGIAALAERATMGEGATTGAPAHLAELQGRESILQWQALWEGAVTLPEASGDKRHRLVIAEYEEYLVDDEQPYDRTPTAKGRRLVFVEHVEIG